MHASGEKIGDDSVGQLSDLVLEHQLAFLEPRNLDLVDRTRGHEAVNLLVESAMFSLEQDEDSAWIVIVHEAVA